MIIIAKYPSYLGYYAWTRVTPYGRTVYGAALTRAEAHQQASQDFSWMWVEGRG